jgi:hypothetical protein
VAGGCVLHVRENLRNRLHRVAWRCIEGWAAFGRRGWWWVAGGVAPEGY